MDEEAAEVVRRIYQMKIDGMSAGMIALKLREEKIEMPAVHWARQTGNADILQKYPDPYKWNSTTVSGILSRREYLGCTVNFKTNKYFKDKRSRLLPQDQWITFENTQEAIIDSKTFNQVREILQDKSRVKKDNAAAVSCRRPRSKAPKHPLADLVFCADCGYPMYFRTSKVNPHGSFVCKGYFKLPQKTICKTPHCVNAKVLEQTVRDTLMDQKSRLIGSEQVPEEMSRTVTNLREQLAGLNKNAEKLTRELQKLYEEHLFSKISDERYETLSAAFDQDLKKIKDEIKRVSERLDQTKGKKPDIEGHIQRLKSFDGYNMAEAIEFIDHIEVYERTEKYCNNSPQRIDVFLK